MNQNQESSSNLEVHQSFESSFLSDENSLNISVINSTEKSATSSSTPINDSSSSSDEWKSIEDPEDQSTTLNDENNWAHFSDQKKAEKEMDPIHQDSWANFQSNSVGNIENDDDFGHFCESSSAKNEISVCFDEKMKNDSDSNSSFLKESENIQSIISACFPLDSSSDGSEKNEKIFEKLPTFTTQNGETTNSSSLWEILSKTAKDPIGIHCQWRQSKIEELFHRTLKVEPRSNSVEESPLESSPENVKNKIEELETRLEDMMATVMLGLR